MRDRGYLNPKRNHFQLGSFRRCRWQCRGIGGIHGKGTRVGCPSCLSSLRGFVGILLETVGSLGLEGHLRCHVHAWWTPRPSRSSRTAPTMLSDLMDHLDYMIPSVSGSPTPEHLRLHFTLWCRSQNIHTFGPFTSEEA